MTNEAQVEGSVADESTASEVSTESAVQAEPKVEVSPEDSYKAGFGDTPEEKAAKKAGKKADAKPAPVTEGEPPEPKDEVVTPEGETPEPTEKSAIDKLKEKHGTAEEKASAPKAWHEMSKDEKIAELKTLGIVNGETQPQAPEVKAEPAKMPDNIPDYLKQIGLDKVTIEAPDENQELKKMGLDEFAKVYPEVASYGVIIGKEMAKSEIQNRIQAGDLVTKEQVSGIQESLKDMQFTIDVSAVHSDYVKINNDPKFKTWVEAQPEFVKKACVSGDSEDAIAVVDAYKESLAKADKAKTNEKLALRKKDVDILHSNTIRSSPRKENKEGEVGYKSGFDSDV